MLRSEIFGLRTALDLRTQQDLERKRVLSVKNYEGTLDTGEAAELSKLNERLRWMPFAFHEGDPLLELFERAAVAEGLVGPGVDLEVSQESLEWARRTLRGLRGRSDA